MRFIKKFLNKQRILRNIKIYNHVEPGEISKNDRGLFNSCKMKVKVNKVGFDELVMVLSS